MQNSAHKMFDNINDAQGIAAFVLGLLSGIFYIYGFCPFTCAFVCAFSMLGSGEFMAACGSLCGILLCRRYEMLVPLIMCALMLLIWKAWQKDKLHTIDRLLILFISNLSLIFFSNSTLKECLLVPLTAVVSTVSAMIIYNGLCAFRTLIKRKRIISEGDLFYIALSVAFVMLLLCSLATEDIHAAYIAAGLIAQLCACFSGINGLFIAELAALGAGFNYITGNFDIAVTGAVSVACIFCSLVKNKGKVFVALTYFCASLLLCVATPCRLTIYDCLIPSVMFICVPQRFIYILEPYFMTAEKKGDTSLKKRIKLLSRAALGINNALDINGRAGDGELAIRQLRAISGLLDTIEDDTPQRNSIRAEVGMACIPKSKCAHTGDSVGTLDTNGKVIIAVSDGMGSGILAHNESSAAVEGFMDMIRAGFNTADSIECVNRRLIARCEAEFYATLDALVIDRRSCIATSVKLGAPPSFLVRNGVVHDICGSALPLGILDSVVPAVKKMQAMRGDLFVILTDGVQDAIGQDLVAAITEQSTPDKTPSQIANALLDIASYDGAEDDMSIVCVRIK